MYMLNFGVKSIRVPLMTFSIPERQTLWDTCTYWNVKENKYTLHLMLLSVKTTLNKWTGTLITIVF